MSIDDTRLELLFHEMVQMCLWFDSLPHLEAFLDRTVDTINCYRGNATDLSLLPSLDYTDIQALQSVGEAAQAASLKYILRNDIQQVWRLVKNLRDARIDIVLDNCMPFHLPHS